MSIRVAVFTFALLALSACSSRETAAGEQTLDSDALVSVAAPRYDVGAGPIVLVDSAHQNYHTIDGRYAPFAQLLRNDGLRLSANDNPFSDDSLAHANLLVIANASAATGSAFTTQEIDAVRRFVENGGSLLLIADHLPFPVAARDLAAAFGVTWLNVYADNRSDGRITRRSGDLMDDPITNGITHIRTFGGSCFHAPGVRPLLRAGRGWSIQTETDSGLSPKSPANGCLIGAVAERGEGRVAVFAEAAMFSAQVLTINGDTRSMGFNAAGAEQNATFVLNVVHWMLEGD